MGEVGISIWLHQLIGRQAGVPMGNRRTADERVGRVHQRPSGCVGSRVDRQVEPKRRPNAGRAARTGSERKFQLIAIALAQSNRGNIYGRIAAT